METLSRGDPFMGNPSMEAPIGMEAPRSSIPAKEWGSWREGNLLPELPDYGDEILNGYAAANNA